MAILFDFGGTLDADGARWSVRFHAAYERAGGRLPFNRFEPLFQESDRRLARLPAIRDAGFRTMLDLQAAIVTDLLAGAGEAIPAEALAPPVYAAATDVVARNRPLLARLADSRPLGVVSNFTGNLHHCLAELGLLDFFDVAIDSAHVGIDKPDPRIFELALSRLTSDPADTWMVGDNPHADLVPAAALGLKTCWVAPADDRRPLPDGVPTARVTTLLELGSVLGVPCTV